MNHLHRGGVVQTYNYYGSSIFIRHPELLRQRPCDSKKIDVQKFYVRREGSEEAMTVLLDTGADNFFVSESCLQKLIKESGSSRAPRRAFLDLGSCKRLSVKKLRTLPGDSYDFVMGEKLLYKYKAIVDYVDHSITFRIGGRRIMVDLEE